MAVIHVGKDSFDKEVRQSKVPVLTDFWADWCMPCKMMGPVFEELSNEYDGKIKFVKVNTDEEGPLATEYDISGIPCLVLMDKGKEIDRIVGFAPKPALKQKIDAVLKKASAK
jgi:thioredoxin 1